MKKKVFLFLALLLPMVAWADNTEWAVNSDIWTVNDETGAMEIVAGTQVPFDDITLTIGENGSNPFTVKNGGTGWGEYNETFQMCIIGNGVNGQNLGGTRYFFNPVKDGKLTVVVRQPSDKQFYVEENGEIMEDFDGIAQNGLYIGTYDIPVKASKTYMIYCHGSKMGFYGFIFEPGGVVPPQSWINIVSNSDMEGTDVSCFFTKHGEVSDEIAPSVIEDGAGKDGTRGVVITSTDDPVDVWDTQFFVRLTQAVPYGAKYRLSFDAKASSETSVGMELHKEPTEYVDWLTTEYFTTEWDHYNVEGNINAEGVRTVVLTLGNNRMATTFNFDNLVFEIQEKNVTKDVIAFEDPIVETLCVAQWDDDGDGKLSETEAAKVSNLGDVFKDNTQITSFNELSYFVALTEIPARAFSGCTNLTAVKLPKFVKTIGKEAFASTGLTEIDLTNIKEIGNGAFSFSNLATVTLPERLTTIGDGAFEGCSSLTKVFVEQETPLAIANSTFTNRANATLYVPSNSGAAYESADYWKEFRAIVKMIQFADENVKALCVANWDTNGDGELDTDEAAAVTTLDEVFKGNADIKSFDELSFFTGLTELLGWTTFDGCIYLQSIIIPANVTSIDGAAFANCPNLSKISVDPSNKVYDSRNNCIIETVTNKLVVGCSNCQIPYGVTTIGTSAFYGRWGMSSILIPESITTIEANAFSDCGLLEITLPASLTTIGSETFFNCWNLTTVIVNNPEPMALENAETFANRQNATLIVPVGSEEAYRAADVWKEFKLITSWTNIVKNSDLEDTDVSCFFTIMNINNPDELVHSTIVDGVGKDGTRAIVVTTNDNSTNPWDTQFFVRMPQKLTPGTKFRLSFDYKSSQEGRINMEYHAEPMDYIVNPPYFYSTQEWNHFEMEGTVNDQTSEKAAEFMRTIAFSLCANGVATTFYFDNIVFEIDQAHISWVNLVSNSEMEGTDVSSFYSRENYTEDQTILPATIVDGAGMDGSRGIVITSIDSPSATWDTQFFLRLPQTLPAGTKYRLSFDYKASQEASVTMEAHEEPSEYIDYGFDYMTFNTTWQHYERVGEITEGQSPEDHLMRTIAFDLSNIETATTYYLDNFVFEIEEANVTQNIIEFEDPVVKAISVAQWDINGDGELSEIEAAKVRELGGIFKGNEEITSFRELRYFAGVTKIPDNAFSGCSNLTAVELPPLTSEIGMEAFQSTALETINLRNATKIGDGAFRGSGLTSLTLPTTMKWVGNEAFKECSKLAGYVDIAYIGHLGFDAFNVCPLITKTSLPSTIVFDESSENSGASFSWCTGLEEVEFFEGTTIIDKYSFFHCESLRSLPYGLPSTLETIGDHAFGYCKSLESIIIPEKVTKIVENAFNGCDALTEVTVLNPIPVVLDTEKPGTFSNRANATLYVPAGSKDAYANAPIWKEFKKIVEIGEAEIDLTDVSAMTDAIYFNPVNASAGANIMVPVKLKNAQRAAGYQFELVLPEGITIADYELTNRNDRSFQLTTTKVSETITRFLVYNMASRSIAEGDAAIINVTLHIANGLAAGKYAVLLQKQMYSNAAGQAVRPNNVTTALTIGKVTYTIGDVNSDGYVDVADIVSVVNYILGKPSDDFVIEAADANNDGFIDVADVVSIVNIILGKNPARMRAPEVARTDNDRLMLTRHEDDSFTLDLDNEGCYVAAQFDVRLSEGQQLEDIRLNGKRFSGHSLSYTEVAENTYRVLVYSMGNGVIRGNNGELLTIHVSGVEGAVAVENIMFITSAKEKIEFAPLFSQTTGIAGINTLTEPADVYSLDGYLVRKSATSLNDLPKGVYIVNGRKVVK